APAQSDTTGKVTVEAKTVAVGVGVSWGDGVLTYRGEQHKVSVEGMSVSGTGGWKVSATGEVSDLKKLEDFAGTYAAAGAGAAAGGGAGGVGPTNPDGEQVEVATTHPG